MNKEKLIENWDSLKDDTRAQILALADKEIKEDYFVPKEGGTYWTNYVAINKEVLATCYTYIGDSCDELFIETSNCFRTEEEAIFYGNCDYYTKRFETYVNRHTDKLDWNNDEQPKYYAYYDCNDDCDDCIRFNDNYEFKIQGATFASSEQILEDAIADIGEENFLKYVMKVEK